MPASAAVDGLGPCLGLATGDLSSNADIKQATVRRGQSLSKSCPSDQFRNRLRSSIVDPKTFRLTRQKYFPEKCKLCQASQAEFKFPSNFLDCFLDNYGGIQP